MRRESEPPRDLVVAQPPADALDDLLLPAREMADLLRLGDGPGVLEQGPERLVVDPDLSIADRGEGFLEPAELRARRKHPVYPI